MNDKRNALWVLIGMVVMAALFMLIGFMAGKAKYDKPIKETIERDTVFRWDTIPQYFPQPVDGTEVKTVYKFLTRVQSNTDTLTLHDSVLVEVPITSKHYKDERYDAYISGYEPSLDSIFVYQKTEYITETITKAVKDSKHFFLDVSGGCEYLPNTKTAMPFAELGLSFKTGRFGVGAYGGYSHDLNENKALPRAKVKFSYDIISF